jgi:RNA polymerase sigma factor (sigma-70 family)
VLNANSGAEPYKSAIKRCGLHASNKLMPLTELQKALVEANYKFAFYMARRLHRIFDLYPDKDDAYQQALLGVMHAATKYDPGRINPKTAKPYTFQHFASHWVLAYMYRGLYMSAHTSNSFSIEVLTKTANIKEDGGAWGDDMNFSQVLAVVPPRFTREENREEAEVALGRLPQRHRRVISMIAEGKLYREIGAELGITRQRVMQLAREAQQIARGAEGGSGAGDFNRKRYTPEEIRKHGFKAKVASLRTHLLHRRHSG